MFFIVILIITAISIASSAAYFSIYGLAQIFSGTFWPVVIMASSLEVGKLVAASYLYRYWTQITFFAKSYFLSSIFVLMLITSAGIFGFLTMGYQQDTLPMKLTIQQIELFAAEKIELEELKVERLDRKKQIDADIAALPNNYVSGRQRLLKSYEGELNQLRTDISTYTTQIRDKTIALSKLKNQTIREQVHTGPIVFIAKVFEQDIDNTVKYLIFLIIFAFDPFAVMLTIGANVALNERKKQKHVYTITEETVDEPITQTTTTESLNIPVGATIEEIQKILDEFNQRKTNLTSAELALQQMYAEMLLKKQVIEQVRNTEV